MGNPIITVFILGVFSPDVWQASWWSFQRRYFQTKAFPQTLKDFYVFHFTITHKGQERICHLTAPRGDVIGKFRIMAWNYLLFRKILCGTEHPYSLPKPVFSPRPVFLETGIFHPRVPIGFSFVPMRTYPASPTDLSGKKGLFFFLALAIFKFVTCGLWLLN